MTQKFRRVTVVRGGVATALAVTTAAFVSACQSAAAPTPVPTTAGSTAAASGGPTPAASTGGSATVAQWKTPPPMTIDPNKTYTAVIKTTDGDMTAELYPKDAPTTVNNFVFLAGQHFYDNVKFHRIIAGFMVQTGDPTGTGSGGPGYRFKDEPVTRQYSRGTLAMANAGPNTNGSQFFIMHQDYALQPNYTIFGKLTAGLDVLDKIANTPVTAGPSGEKSSPTQDVRIQSVEIQTS